MITSIVMVVRDRHRLTEQSLYSLFLNTDPHSFNLTIVDDGSTDFRVRKLIDTYVGRHPRATSLRLDKSGHVLSQIKNIGVEWSRQVFGDEGRLYLSDNDVYFKKGWLEQLTTLANKTGILSFALWGGQVHPFHQSLVPAVRGNEEILFEHSVLDGPSWLMDWSTWDEIGGFDPHTAPGPCQSEEYPFCKALIEKGGRIGVANPHCVIHTGLTQTDGKLAPGADVRGQAKVEGVYYE